MCLVTQKAKLIPLHTGSRSELRLDTEAACLELRLLLLELSFQRLSLLHFDLQPASTHVCSLPAKREALIDTAVYRDGKRVEK